LSTNDNWSGLGPGAENRDPPSGAKYSFPPSGRRIEMKRAFLITLMSVACLCGLVALTKSSASSDQEQKKRISKQIDVASAVPIHADNSQGCLLFIQEASVKEISGEDYKILVGEAPRHFKETTYPEITMVNSSSKTITSFILMIRSAAEQPRSGHGVYKKNLAIAPGSSFKVTPGEWLKPDRVTIQKEGKFVNVLQQPLLDSSKFWIPGSASDLKVTIGLVDFEDGTRWIIPEDSNW
jgi:hypothetical protein